MADSDATGNLAPAIFDAALKHLESDARLKQYVLKTMAGRRRILVECAR